MASSFSVGNNKKKSVAVWEYEDNLYQWIPYSAEVCVQLENARQKKLKCLCLGDVEPQLKLYSVNLASNQQTRYDTGTRRPVRHKHYNIESCPGQGVYWQWFGDQSSWCFYSIAIQQAIEAAFQRRDQNLDLEQFSVYLPYTVDFSNMIQIRKLTKNIRHMKRSTGRPYPVTMGDSSALLTVMNGNLPSQSTQPLAASGGTNSTAIPSTSNGHVNGNGSLNTNQNGASAAESPSSSGLKLMSWFHSKLKMQTSDPTPTRSSSSGVSPPTRSKSKSMKSRSFSKRPINRNQVIVENIPRANYKLTAKAIFEKYTKLADLTGKEDCPICCEDLSTHSSYSSDDTALCLVKCGHSFHHACLEAMIENSSLDTFIQCPTCKEIYGTKIGNQPPGQMKYYSISKSLPGFDCDTICIEYNFKSGYQSEEHPQPGKSYSANTFPRTCYLPNNDKGRKVLNLLCIAWQRHLIFTIGTSVTTGQNDVVTWNEIHHKTEFSGNYSGHGYPDDKYFDNVLLELAAQGITEDDDL